MASRNSRNIWDFEDLSDGCALNNPRPSLRRATRPVLLDASESQPPSPSGPQVALLSGVSDRPRATLYSPESSTQAGHVYTTLGSPRHLPAAAMRHTCHPEHLYTVYVHEHLYIRGTITFLKHTITAHGN